jgi:serine/threonine protein kinase
MFSSRNEGISSIQLYGITQDPKTLNYMIVMRYMELGSFRSNLMIKKYNPYDKYHNLYRITKSLLSLHKCNLVHGDFHSGNLLLWSHCVAYISDLGLSRPVDKPNNSNEIYGILPYIAPEVLRGKPYTKAADIYSFGIIMWEMTSGIPAFNNVPHDFNLSLNVCQGLRPEVIEIPKIFDDAKKQKIFEDIESEYTRLMKRCWNSDPDKRPTAEELYENCSGWELDFSIYSDDKRIPVPGKE